MAGSEQETIKYHTTDRICKIHVGDVVVGQVGRLCGCGPCYKPRYTNRVKEYTVFRIVVQLPEFKCR